MLRRREGSNEIASGKPGAVHLASVVERVSRFTVLLKNCDRQSRPVMEALIAGLAAFPFAVRRSITFDRGTEFAAWPRLQAGLGVQTWICDPQSPWQEGIVENTNGTESDATCRAREVGPRADRLAAGAEAS